VPSEHGRDARRRRLEYRPERARVLYMEVNLRDRRFSPSGGSDRASASISRRNIPNPGSAPHAAPPSTDIERGYRVARSRE